MASIGVRLTWRDFSGELSTRQDRRGRQTAFVWQTWQGYYLRVLSRSSLNITVFWSFTKRSVYSRGRWSLAGNFSKHNYCHACQTRFAVFFLLPSHCVSSPLPYDDMPDIAWLNSNVLLYCRLFRCLLWTQCLVRLWKKMMIVFSMA